MKNKRVFIIHSSEIVRKGIIAILRNYFNFEYSHYTTIKEINPNKEKTENGLLFIFLELADSPDMNVINKLQKNSTVKTIGICKENVEQKKIHGFANCISINSSSKDITDIIHIHNYHSSKKNYVLFKPSHQSYNMKLMSL